MGTWPRSAGMSRTVSNPDDIPNYLVKETCSSKSGEKVASASGDSIASLGGMQVPLITGERTKRMVNFTAAPVTKPLASVKQLCGSGHVVIFDDDCSYVCNQTIGEVNMLGKQNGNYMVDCCILLNEDPFGV